VPQRFEPDKSHWKNQRNDGFEDSLNNLIGERELSKLKWRCRRGLLENDIFIERFFKKFESELTLNHAAGLAALMELGDNDLLDLHLCRKEIVDVDAALDSPAVNEVLKMLRAKV
jgi:antitoxin CptB